MAISGPSSYVSTTEEFIAHWGLANATLGAPNPIVLAEGANLALLAAKQSELVVKRTLLQGKLILLEVARGDIEVRKLALLELFNKFTSRVRALSAGTKWARALPTAPGIGEGQGNFIEPLDKAASLWNLINADPALADIVIVGVTQGQFATQVAELKAAYHARTAAGTEVQVTREERNDLQDEIYEWLKSYRQAVPTHFESGHALVDSLPRLTPAAGSTPDAVTADGEWDEAAMLARISFTLSTAPDFAAYELRYTPGPVYSNDDDIVIDQITDINSLEFMTNTGLLIPGVTATFKVFVKTTTGNEKGSNAVSVTRMEAPA